MGLFSGLLGNASQKSNEAVEQELELILIEGSRCSWLTVWSGT